jgi:uncharacterized membrane protein HdeD (DUF308 family)
MPDLPISREDVRELTWAWWLILLLGVLGIVAGVIVLLKPSDSLTTLAVICGVFVLLDSIGELVVALFAKHGAAAALVGVLGIVIGILLIRHPVGGVLAVALLIGIWLVALGVIRFVRAFELDHRAWNLLVAVVEIVAGIVIVASPHIGFATLALLVGISFLLNGFALGALGWTMHKVRSGAKALPSESDLPSGLAQT